MGKIKPHKTVEQIAKKHRLDVSFIQKQLDMGEPIEHEHTKDHELAMDIALQHLDEIPDYYTRLKKMEADAKKFHKKFKDVKEESDSALSDVDTPVHFPAVHGVHVDHEKRYCTKCKKTELRSECKYGPKYWDLFSLPEKLKEETMGEEKRYCPLCDKRETRSECSYGGKTWDKVSVKDHEYSMARSELSTMSDAVKRLQKKVGKGEGNLEAWVQSKITKAADYIDTVADYIASGEMEESTNPLKDPKTQIKISRGASALTPKAAEQLGPKAKELQKKAAAKVDIPRFEEKLVDKILSELQEEDPCWKGYTQVGMKMKKGKKVPNCVPSKGVPKAKGYKKEDVTIEDANGNTFAEVVDIIKPEPIKGFKSQVDEATRLQAQTGNVIGVTLNWRGKYYSLKMFFPQVKLPTRKEITNELQKVYPGCNVIYHSVSEIQPGQPFIQPCGPQGGSFGHPGANMKYVKPCGEQVEYQDLEEGDTWHHTKYQNPKGGLTAAGVKKYREEHPGSKLKTAVRTEPSKLKKGSKSWKRRKSFCSRMKGMKAKLTSAKTAGDPNSRINKSLRAWNC